jgi:hypothetical protein
MVQRQPRKRAARSAPADDRSDGELTGASDVRTAFISGNSFRARAVQYVVVDGDALFEGDIVLGPEDQVAQESEILQAELRGEVAAGVVLTGNQFRWTDCVVPFDIDPALPNQNRVTDAIAHWQQHTQFRFVPRTAAHNDYVTFRPASGCSSSVGKRGGQQFVNLGPNCTTGNTIHEIGHTIGLWHEQSREDRDAFVRITWANIQAGMEHNFNQHIADGDDVGAYDYGSIMHYPRDAFGINGAETITPVDPNAQIGQRTQLSPGDIAAANSLCPGGGGVVTVKEPIETAAETLKEIIETAAETRKDRIVETVKELSPETLKERIGETRKELIETVREQGGTFVERVQPGLGQTVLPGVAGAGVPFAFRTAAPADASGAALDELAERVAALEAATLELQEGHIALGEHIAALFAQLGLQ